jgi:dihydroflavonol-4-reductase
VVRASYYDVDSLRDAIKDSEYILHIAGVTKARKQREYHDGNVLATRNLLDAAAADSHLKKFCFVSSLSAVGPSADGTPLNEESPCNPITTYGVTKLEAETVCQLHADRIPIVILRPPPVYGPRDQDILEVFRWLKRGILPIFGNLGKSLSVVYGPELARGIVDATLSEKTTGETYFVADAAIHRFVDILDIAARILGIRPMRMPLPAAILYPLAGASEIISAFGSRPSVLNIEKARDLLQTHWVCTPKKLEDHIGFRTRITIEEGLKLTLDWYKEFGWL